MDANKSDGALREVLEGLKQALHAERVGHEFYKNAAQTTQDAKGRAAFERLALDEAEHFDWLLKQYKAFAETGRPDLQARLAVPEPLAESAMFSDDLKRRVGTAHFEMSALTIAVQLELNGIRHYRQLSEMAKSPEARKMFEDLSKWEQGHCDLLMRQQQELQDDYWAAAGFERF
jgi:rubrerythrin